ncbi:MAG: peptidoglycan-binding protein [Acidimicrobiia bacterium]
MTSASPLRSGDLGDAVRDLQQRLIAAGIPVPPDEIGMFGTATETGVREFQTRRTVRVDGIVGRETWAALVESGFELGDRLLYLRSPNLRGDDVTELQRTLNRLGFDSGREDGILGPNSANALREFQRNSGLSVDGIAGPATLEAFARVSAMAAGSVATVREQDLLSRPEPLGTRRLYIAVDPGFGQIGTPLGRWLTAQGAQVMLDVSGADDHLLAERANRWHSHFFLAVRGGDRVSWQCLYYASGNFRSERGCHAAHIINEELAAVIPHADDPDADGRAYEILRETRMAAVVCGLADADAPNLAVVLAHADEVGAAIGRGIRRAFEEPRPAPPA